MMAGLTTADICDSMGDRVTVLAPVFRHYGGKTRFAGQVVCLRVFEDIGLIRGKLGEAGDGRVLVVDGGGSQNAALLGDQLAQLAIDNGWAGVLVAGRVRDAEELGGMPLGVLALGTCPRRPASTGAGEADIPIEVGGVVIRPGHYLYADLDGAVVSSSSVET